jgi:hypothetical protein
MPFAARCYGCGTRDQGSAFGHRGTLALVRLIRRGEKAFTLVDAAATESARASGAQPLPLVPFQLLGDGFSGL